MDAEARVRAQEHPPKPAAASPNPSRQTRTDPSLIDAIRDPANHEAWRTFERRYAPIIRAYCTKRGMRSVDAEDVSQEVFLRITVHGFADRYSPSMGTFRSYLFRVTRSVASTFTQFKPVSLDTAAMPAESAEEWDSVWKAQAIRLALRRVERTASWNSKRVLAMTLRGVAPAVIAESTGMKLDAVYKCRARLRARLEAACKEYLLDPREIER